MDDGARKRVSWRRAAALAALLVLVPTAAHAAAKPAGTPCGRTDGLRCLTVEVPLDRSGRVPGKVALHVEVLPAEPQRGVMFLVAGGPGQGSADVFELGVPEYADDFRNLAPGYTLVAVDNRGTGRSGQLHCPMLNPAHPDAPAGVAACAKHLGARRDFYGTADHAEDLEAVRKALGYRSIALFGVSYGTKLVLSYALAHPGRVERLLLDSVSLPEGDNPFLTDFFSRFPGTLARFCAGGACRGVTADFPGEVAALANDLAAKPIRGEVRQPGGGRRTEHLGGNGFLSLVVEADLNPAIAAELPALVHAARRGDPEPLLRASELASGGSAGMYPTVNLALFIATTCRDGPFPWDPGTPLTARPTLVTAAIAALPDGAMGPFGRWVSRNGNAQACVGWPSPKGGAALGRGPLPDVPVLALSGELDLRTPTADAASVVSRFPHGRLLVVPGTGHSVLSSASECAQSAVSDWLDDKPVPKRCPAVRAYLDPIAAFPTATAAPATPAGPLATLALVRRTLREAEATWLLTALSGAHGAAGLEGGTLASGEDSFTLERYSLEPGVQLSGRIRVSDSGPPFRFVGVVDVKGRAASAGTLVLQSGGGLQGALGGTSVGR